MFKLNRLSIAALFDQNVSWGSAILDVVLATTVAALGASLIFKRLFTDLSLVVFCVSMAGAEFSLLKSVQPDPASPVHG